MLYEAEFFHKYTLSFFTCICQR